MLEFLKALKLTVNLEGGLRSQRIYNIGKTALQENLDLYLLVDQFSVFWQYPNLHYIWHKL